MEPPSNPSPANAVGDTTTPNNNNCALGPMKTAQRLTHAMTTDDLINDVITVKMLTSESVRRAHYAITPVMRDLIKTLEKHPPKRDNGTFANLDYEIDIDESSRKKTLQVFKHPVENFLHTLTQNGFRFYVNGALYSSDIPTTIRVVLEFGEWTIKVKNPGMNTRMAWAESILAFLLYKCISHFQKDNMDLIMQAMDNLNINVKHEMADPKQAVEDTLVETEVVKVAENTAITQEVDDSTNECYVQGDDLQHVATTEQLSNLAPIAQRFVRIFDTSRNFSITNVANELIFSLDIPNGLYSYFDSTIVSALRSYTMIKTDVELLIKINANQAQCGRYVVAAYPCRNQALFPQPTVTDSVYRMLQREHAIVDISSSNDVNLVIPFENLRPFVPIQTDEIGTVTGGSYSTVVMRCLSPLRIADSGNPVCPFQVFARLTNTRLAGMRYPVSLPPVPDAIQFTEPEASITHESPGSPSKTDSVLQSTVAAAKAVPVFGNIFGIAAKILGNTSVSLAKMASSNQERVKEFEQRLIYIGMINKDRPIDISHPAPLLPTPIHSYAYGRTPYVSKKLRLEPEGTVPHLPDHNTVNDVVDVLELARIPGFAGRFNVNETSAQGDLLMELPAIPFDPRYASMYPDLGASIVQYPPVTYFYHLYNFYSGSIIYEFVPVKTPSHNFSIQVGFVPFNGIPGEVTEAQLQSCRWKTIDFRASENGQFTVPWLSTSVMRTSPMSQSGYFSSRTDLGQTVNDPFPNTFFEMKDPGKVVVRLVNELNPTPIVSPSIEVLVFVKAHPNLRYFSPTSLRAPLHSTCGLNKVTRDIFGFSQEIAEVPCANTGNFDYSVIQYEGPGSPQMGDEQTMGGDDLTQAPGPQVQNIEHHTNILDVCRRFYLQSTVSGVFSSKIGAAVTGPFPPFSCIPVSPYTMVVWPFLQTGRPARTNNMTTPRDALLQCFRWMRGTMDVVVHSLTDIPLEVTYLPATDYPYAISSANVTNPLPIYRADDRVPIYSLPMAVGQPTELLDPRVNPMLTVEPPMYNPNNYIDLQSMLLPVNGTLSEVAKDRVRSNFADYSANYLGNLVIRGVNGVPVPEADTPSRNFKARVLTALGDDCTLHHFMGVPPTMSNQSTLRYTIVSPTPVFRDRNRTRAEVQTSLIAAGVEPNPGPVQSFLPKGLAGINPFTQATGMIQSIKDLFSAPKRISDQIEDVKTMGSGFVDQIKMFLAAYTTGIDMLEIAALAMAISSALSKETNMFAQLTVVCIIFKMTGVFHAEAVSRAMSKLSGIFGQNSDAVQHEIEGDTLTGMVSVFTSLIFETYFSYASVDTRKISLDEGYVKQVFTRTFKNFNVMRSGAMCILMTRLCAAIKTLWNSARRWVRGLEKHDILTDDPEFVRSFMIDYEFFMDERNLPAQSMVQRHRDRFWNTVIAAYYLKSVLATVDKKHVNTTLANAVREVCQRASQLNSHMSAPPVRYEPYSLWLWGEPGIGKTTMMHTISIDMAKNIGVQRGSDPIYVRSPHSVWWNGYTGEPITLIDDANGVNDPTILGRCISEFQAIKTSAKMRIEMPRLEEKNAEMTSVILGVCSNVSEWTSSMIVDKEAFRRRRNTLAKVVWSSAAEEWFRENAGQKVSHRLPQHILDNNAHVAFVVSSNPAANELTGTTYDYATFHEKLLKDHQEYHERETKNMLQRYEKSLSLSKQVAERVMDRETLRTALMTVLLGCETTEVVAETMKRNLFELKDVSPQRYNELPLHTRNMLEKMSATEARHEAPGIATSSDMSDAIPNMSTYFKEVLFPSYQVGNESFAGRLLAEFAPWKHDQQRTFDMDLLTSDCVACRQPQNERRVPALICPRSTRETQHWICRLCYPQYLAAGSENCPTCRCETPVAITQSQVEWRYYTKMWHVVKTLTKRASAPIRMTLDVIWRNAAVLSLVASFATWTTLMIVRYKSEVDQNHRNGEDLNSFISQYGMFPDKYFVANGQCVFSINGVPFVKENDTGLYRSAFSDSSDVAFEAGRSGKGKSPPPSGRFEALMLDAKDKVLKMEDVIKAQKEDREQPATSSDGEEFRSPNPEEFVFDGIETVKCAIEHGNRDEIEKLKRQKNVMIFINNEEGRPCEFTANIRTPGNEVETVTVPLQRCENLKCKLNDDVDFLCHSYYDMRYPNWLKAKCIPPDTDEFVPPIFRKAFLEQNPHLAQAPEVKWYSKMIEYQSNLLSALKGTLVKWLSKIYEVLCNQWYYIITFVAMLFAAYYGIKYYYSEEEGISFEVQHEAASGERRAGAGRSDSANTRLYVRNKAPATHEMKLSVNRTVPPNITNVADLIMKNKFSINCAGMDVVGMVIMNNFGIFPRHAYCLFAQLAAKGNPIILKNTDKSSHLITQSLGMHIAEDNVRGEYVIFQHKNLTGKDIRHHIYSTIYDEVSYPPYAYAVDLMDMRVLPVHISAVFQCPEGEGTVVTTPWEINGDVYHYTSEMYEYLVIENFRGKGKCGSPILNPEGKIIGIHFAGKDDASQTGYSAPVFRDNFMSIAIAANEQKVSHEMVEFPNMRVYSHYPNPPYHMDKTKLQPSAIADKAWESTTQPCIQSEKDPRYTHGSTPLLDGVSTIGAHTNPPDTCELRSATRAVAEELIGKMPTPSMPAPVSVFEAVSAANHSHVESMNLATSAGLPWIADFPRQTSKAHYILHTVNKEGHHQVKLTDVFKRKYDVQFKQRLTGCPPREPFWAHLKDERRKVEKLLSFGGTRVINVSPLELVLSSRRALLPMMDAFHSDPVALHHAIGLSPESPQWTELVESLRKKSDRIIQLDFSKFSDSMPWQFVDAAFEVIVAYYETYNMMTLELDNLLQTLKLEITQSLLCVEGTVYELMNGVLQGHPITSLINSLVNIIEQVYVWIKLTSLTGSEFFRRCGIVVMGDDVVISVPKRFLRNYNGQAIAAEFARMNIVVTDETKNRNTIQRFQCVTRFDFLSCSYMLHPYRNLYLAPTDPASIFDTALWIKRKDGPFNDATRENMEQSLMNCFGHGPLIYEMYRATLEFLSDFQFRSWFELDYIFYGAAELVSLNVVDTNAGLIAGAHPKSRERMQERALLDSDEPQCDSQYWSAFHIAQSTLDTSLVTVGEYACKCRYDCEQELLDRVRQVEVNTKTPRRFFLKFTSQKEGCAIYGARISTEKASKAFRASKTEKRGVGYVGGRAEYEAFPAAPTGETRNGTDNGTEISG